MKLLLICVLYVVFNAAKAGYNGNCEIEGFDKKDWRYYYYEGLGPIKDTAEGIIASYKTHNITGMTVENSKYVDATLKDGELQLYMTEAFKNFEVDIKGSYYQYIELELDFTCADGKGDYLEFNIHVIDTNNHLPIFTKDVYEYKLGSKIPRGYDVTDLLRISASDVDFTNNEISFSFKSASGSDVEESEYFRFLTTGKNSKSDRDNFYTEIIAKNEIRHSIREEFTIVATDVGKPEVSKSTAKLIIDVHVEPTDDSSAPNIEVHPPVFSKNLYYADYSRNRKLIIEEPIKLLFGEANLILEQSNYTQYFEISYDDSKKEVQVKTKEPVPNKEFKNVYLVVMIEAKNPGLNIPGKTNLFINLPSPINENEPADKLGVCSFSQVYVVPMILCFSVILLMLIGNVWVVSLYLKKQKLTVDLSMPPPYKVDSKA